MKQAQIKKDYNDYNEHKKYLEDEIEKLKIENRKLREKLIKKSFDFNKVCSERK